MIVVQISDTHLSLPTEPDTHGQARADNLQTAVTAINDLAPGADVVIHTGDIAQTRHPEEYGLAREILSQLHVPLFVVPGNRDCRESLRRTFADDGYMNGSGEAPILYSVDDHPVRLIGFDTQSGRERKGDIDPARLHWLDDTLGEAPDRTTAVFMHHPPIAVSTSDFPWQWQRDESGDELAAVFAEHPQVARIFSGHSHRDYQGFLNAIPVSTTPSIAVDLRLGEFEPRATSRPIFQRHIYDPKRGFETETVIAESSSTEDIKARATASRP